MRTAVVIDERQPKERKMSFKIEPNVPVAPRGGGKGRAAKYPFRDMKVGDSFLVNGADPRKVIGAACAYVRASKSGWKFTTRKTPDGHRCWRIA